MKRALSTSIIVTLLVSSILSWFLLYDQKQEINFLYEVTQALVQSVGDLQSSVAVQDATQGMTNKTITVLITHIKNLKERLDTAKVVEPQTMKRKVPL